MRAPCSSIPFPSLPFFFFFFFFFFLFTVPGLSGDCSEYDHHDAPMATLGGIHDSHTSQNSAETEALARFAVDEHNNKHNALLEFARVVRAREQVVAGTMHYLTLEAIDAGEKKIYEAKVWVKPWMNFKELQEFKHAGDGPSFTSADLGVKKDGHKPGWQSVPTNDPQVQDAANHALKSIQQRSNSLVPYLLHEVADAKAEEFMTQRGNTRWTGSGNEDITEVVGAMREIAAALAQQAAAQAQQATAQAAAQAQQAAAQAAAQAQQAAAQQIPNDRTTLMDFKKLDPPEFHGDLDPEKAEQWVQELEEIYTAMECSDERRVSHSAFQLKGDAKMWWKATQQMIEGRGEIVTWGVFKQYFLEKYFPVSARQAKEGEFTRLYQGAMTVHEYAARFESLAKYSKYLLITADEGWKCRKFEEGLRFEIKRVVVPFGIQSFTYLVDKCKIVEDLDRVQRVRSMNRGNMGKGGPVQAQKGKAIQQKPYARPPQQRSYSAGSGTGYRPPQQQQQLPLKCWKCEKPHMTKDCSQMGPTCFNCGKMSHLAKECRAPPKGGQGSSVVVQRPMTSGRVFTLSGVEASQSEDLVQEEGQMEGH